MFLLAAPLAHATVAHHTIDRVERTATGARVHVLMMSGAGFNDYSVGITSAGGTRHAPQRYAKSGSTKGVSPVVLEIPYSHFKSGQQVRVISRWRYPFNTHNWGDGPAALVTLP